MSRASVTGEGISPFIGEKNALIRRAVARHLPPTRGKEEVVRCGALAQPRRVGRVSCEPFQALAGGSTTLSGWRQDEGTAPWLDSPVQGRLP